MKVWVMCLAASLLGAGCVLQEPAQSDPITPRPMGDDGLVTISGPPTNSQTPSPRPGDRVVPVVKITSALERPYPNGTVWAPPFPGYHGCPDAFSIDAATRKIIVNDDQ